MALQAKLAHMGYQENEMTVQTMARRIARPGPEQELRIKLTRGSQAAIRHGRRSNADRRLIRTFTPRAPQAR